MTAEQAIALSLEQRDKEQLARLLQRIERDKATARRLAKRLHLLDEPKNRHVETYSLIDAI